MNLNDFAKSLVAKNHFVKASFGGFAGAGKTRTATEFVIGCYKDMKLKKPVLLIDNEKGSRFLIQIFQTAGVPVLVKDTVSLNDVLQAMDFLQKGEIDFLFVDSLTKVYYHFVRDYLKKNGLRFMTLQDWGKIIPEWQEKFSDRFVDLSGNFVFTGRGGFQYEKEEDEIDEETGKVKHKGGFIKSGVKLKLAGETPFEPDLNVWMEQKQEVGAKNRLQVWREAQILKDRSGLIDGKVFKNPKYKDFQPVVKFILGVPTGEVSGVTNDDAGAPVENFDYYRRKQAREIEVEKIKALFDRLALGSSGADKRLRVLLNEKCIGTTSSTELEKMDAETLFVKRQNLEKVIAKLEAVPNEREHWADLVAQCADEWMQTEDELPFAGNGKESAAGKNGKVLAKILNPSQTAKE
jgi:hypothetical protein